MTGRTTRILSAWGAVMLGLSCGIAEAQVGPSSQNVKKPAPKKPAARKPAPRKPAEAPLVRVRTVERPKPMKRPAVARVRPPRRTRPKTTAAAKPPVTPVKPPATAVPPPTATVIKVKPPIRVPGPDAGEIARRAAQRQAEQARRAAQREAELARQAAEKQAQLAAERLRVAGDWQKEEAATLVRAVALGRQLTAPPLQAVIGPEVPAPAAPPAAPVTYRQKVTLVFHREDGAAFDSALVRRGPTPLAVNQAGSRLEFEGPRLQGNGAEVQLALPPGWEFAAASDARVSLADFPGLETRIELPALTPQNPVPLPRSEPLFPTPQAELSARMAVQRLEQKSLEPGAYPRPAASLAPALQRLAEARKVLDLIKPPTPASSREARLLAWQEAERARRLLDAAAAALSDARQVMERFDPAAIQQVLKREFTLDYSPVADLARQALVRLTQYRAEAAWWQSQAADPVNPDRRPAIEALRDTGGASPDLAQQLAHYTAVSQREARYRAAVQSGAVNPPPARPVLVTRHLTRTLVVRRPFVDLRLAEGELKPEDRVTLAGQEVQFTLRDGFWHARVPRDRLAAADRLRFARRTYISELQGELVLPKLDPYSANGNLLRAPEMRPVGIRSLAVAAGAAGEVPMFRELSADMLRELRRECEETEKDGAVWLTHRTVPLVLRLRKIQSSGETPADKKEKSRGERLAVEGARLDGPAAGQVAGLRVGSSTRAVETVLGTSVERTGSLRLMEGALELVLRDGIVQQIVIHREFALPDRAE